MLEELGLIPFSAEEIAERILAKYGVDLKYIEGMKSAFEKMDKTDKNYPNLDISLHDSREAVLPLSIAAQGYLSPLRCDMIGGDDRPVGITGNAIKSALESKDFKEIAKDIVRFVNAPQSAWAEAVGQVGKLHQIEPTERTIGYVIFDYNYDSSMLVTGKKSDKFDFLMSMREDWSNAVRSESNMLAEQVKNGSKMIMALNSLEDLEYRMLMERKFNDAMKTVKLDGPLPIYANQAVTVIDNKGWGFRFRGFGPAKYFMEALCAHAMKLFIIGLFEYSVTFLSFRKTPSGLTDSLPLNLYSSL